MNLKWLEANKKGIRQLSAVVLIAVVLIAVVLAVAIFIIIFSYSWSEAVSSIAMLGLLVLAIIAGIYAKKNTEIIELQNRNRIFIELMREMGETQYRIYRGTVHRVGKDIEDMLEHKTVPKPKNYCYGLSGVSTKVDCLNRIVNMSREGTGTDQHNEARLAIEETIASLDRVGYFLLHGKDENLVGDAPTWIWTISDDMAKIVGDYVIERQTSGDKELNYGKYFVELAEKSREKLRQQKASNR
ncbi:hypothetical protein ACFLX7_00475 [Chloroflexota bacterium]